jgi:hypothetical protein
MKHLDQDDQAIKTPTYHDREIAWLYQEGLLSRLDADVFDILATTGSISSGNRSSGGNEQAEGGNE